MKKRGVEPPADIPEAMEIGIARLFGLAWISYLGDMSFATAQKKYGNINPSSYWVEIATQVVADFRAGRFGPDAAMETSLASMPDDDETKH
jgi:hypothetical protein